MLDKEDKNKNNDLHSDATKLLQQHKQGKDPFVSPIEPNRVKDMPPKKPLFTPPTPLSDPRKKKHKSKTKTTSKSKSKRKKQRSTPPSQHLERHEFTNNILARLRTNAYDGVAFIMLVPHTCHANPQCAAFPEFWLNACLMYPDHVFFSHCSSIPGQGNCGPEVPAPQVLEWDGLQFEGETFIIPLIALHNHNLSGLNMGPTYLKYFFLSFPFECC